MHKYGTQNFTLLIVILLLNSCTFFAKKNAQSYLKDLGMEIFPSTADFRELPTLPTDPEHLRSFSSTDEKILRLQTFPASTEEEAKKIFQYRSRGIVSLFETRFVPYRGKVTVEDNCLSKNNTKAEIQKSDLGFTLKFDLMATKNFVYGTCIDSENNFKSQYLLIYCKKSKVVLEAKLFYNKDASLVKEPLIRCL